MEIKFIGQGYNLNINSSVAQELITALKTETFESFKCLVAFASYSGVSALTPHILTAKNHIKNFKIIVGIDNQVTSREALEELLLWKVDTYIYHSTSPNIFHPKVYLFEGKTELLSIIGSNNLTEFGLVKNVEAAITIKYTNAERKDIKVNEEVENYFQDLFLNKDNNLLKLTPVLIEQLNRTKRILPSEKERNKVDEKNKGEKNTSDNINTESKVSDYFTKRGLQKNPLEFKPKRVRKKKKEIVLAPNVLKTKNKKVEKSYNVLVAEIGGGNRWKQISFSKNNFESFFEVPIIPGINHFLNLKYIDETGCISKTTEKVKAIVKKSSNYNLEPKKVGESTVHYDNINKPIILFVKLDSTHFIYHFQTKGSIIYNELDAILPSKTGIRRMEISLNNLIMNCPSLSFLYII